MPGTPPTWQTSITSWHVGHATLWPFGIQTFCPQYAHAILNARDLAVRDFAVAVP
jgi:hypothetical protein